METESIPSTASSQPVLEDQNQTMAQPNEKAQIKGLLAEARNTRDMIVGFRSAVESGSYNGNKMLDLAKGLSFIEAILKQNNAHINDLQERLNA